MSFQVFKHESISAVHRPGVLRFEFDLVGVTIVGTIKKCSLENCDWNVASTPLKLVYVDALNTETPEFDPMPEGIAKHTLIENSMWLIGDRLAGWFVDGEQACLAKVELAA